MTTTRPVARRLTRIALGLVVVVLLLVAIAVGDALGAPGDDGPVAKVAEWGSTVGQAAYIHRSGFGVTATGTEIYVGGPALSVCTLGRILQNAGVVRGMELDINPTWVSGTYFHDRPGGPPQGFRLFSAERVAPEHYLSPTSRDWYAWYLRP